MGIPSDERYGSTAELARIHMKACAMLCDDQVQNLNQGQQKLYLAFELGVLEYYHRTILTLDESKDANEVFFEFLIFYSNGKYQKNQLQVFDFWQMLAVQSLMHEERKLGFESINNYENIDGTRRAGHAPPIYFMKALRLNL